MTSKVMSMREAIGRFVPDGCSVAMGTALEALIPFAAGHEIIRQRRRGLTLIGPISDILFDQLIGAECVARVVAAWVGNVSAGLGHNFRRAVEQEQPGPLAVEDNTNFTIALGLLAGSLGVPFIPAKTALGTDIPRSNPKLRVWDSPFDGERYLLVPAIVPDVAILHVQRADGEGGAHCWGNLGVTKEAGQASRGVILVAEELVATEVIRSDPNRILVPPTQVMAVVHEPMGGHPSPVQGYYNRDHAFFTAYHKESRTQAGFAAWLDKWIAGVPDRKAYVEQLGRERVAALAVRQHLPAAPVDYGY